MYKHLGHLPLLFPGHSQRAGSEVEQLRIQLASIDVGITGDSLTCYATEPTPNNHSCGWQTPIQLPRLALPLLFGPSLWDYYGATKVLNCPSWTRCVLGCALYEQDLLYDLCILGAAHWH